MGWTVLYIAFGIVALWLLGEVLLQYKARLRWRLLAFTGFMGVVLGVLIPNIFVIALGAIAFAVGQTYVTLSFRRGFSTGWAIGGSPGASRRRKAGSGQAEEREPALEVSDLEYEPVAYEPPAYEPERPPAPAAAVYEPEPLPDDTGQYGIYDDAARAAHQPQQPHAGAAAGAGTHEYSGGYDAYPGYGQQQPAGQDGYVPQDAYHSGQDTYPGQDVYAQQYGYDAGQQQYAAYTDPYTGSANSGQQYGSYDSFGGQQQYADPYGGQQQYGGDTPPGGVWVPQQRERDGEQFPPIPQEEPRRQGYQDPDYNEQQYRY
ncbi:hypothetical protein OIE62_12815 [Streptomyces scopuliridis]|uniref:Uncharacterized protein n=1 Tax=Streptomyces scopuliridis TaxID=452529 RepID=A0ACD4ZRY3_9ACTN|nr:hypothetical protein [Streptomyces scopuliridis]WSB36270.1 hypothetical protein OG949_27835 [Streptomyces scopuliridis]WSC00567.1 hypothetical protein OG835_28580 [Streptomyces scopuliridis]WSC05822.1 hypothetical protein OIE62_12815 [Streptomyces scopuliridis]